MAARLLKGHWFGRCVQAVHGPEDLSYARAAEIVSAAIGHSIRVEEVSDDGVRQKMIKAGMSEKAAGGYVQMSASLREGFVPEQKRTIVSTTPTTLAAWASSTSRPALES